MKPVLFTFATLALFVSLASCGEGSQKLDEDQAGNTPATAPATAEVADFKIEMSHDCITSGQATYQCTCAPCHGQGGKGDGPAAVAFNPKPRDHTNGAYMDKLTNAHIMQVIKHGGAPFGYPGMPAQPQLADDTVKNVIAYMRSLSKTYKQ